MTIFTDSFYCVVLYYVSNAQHCADIKILYFKMTSVSTILALRNDTWHPLAILLLDV